MENWGSVGVGEHRARHVLVLSTRLITYCETYLLVDTHISAQETKQEVALIVAHELAHQWFGNLVVSRSHVVGGQLLSWPCLDHGMVE